jgi:Plant mobile domain
LLHFRLNGAGLLAVSCLVAKAGEAAPRGAKKYIHLDWSLLSALVDRWRPETHTFHLPCGEMAPTLQDVACLLGLPLRGLAVGPRVVPHPAWREDLQARFAGVARDAEAEPVAPHTEKTTGPDKKWLLQFQVQHIFSTMSVCYPVFRVTTNICLCLAG